MKVELEDLKSKYYETWMTVTLDDGRSVSITLSSSDNKPSAREEYLVEHPEEICDGHYEREATLLVAEEILRRLA